MWEDENAAALAASPIAEIITGDPKVDAAHRELRVMEGAFRLAKADPKQPEDVLRMMAELVVEANHDYQRARYGRVRSCLCVSAVMR